MQHVETPAAPVIKVDGREVLSFGGCSYLGLAHLPEILGVGQAALGDLGSTAQLPRHYGFQSPANLESEEAARQFFGAEDAMYFATGYLFPLIALPGLVDDYDVVVLDETAHFCLTEGARAAGKEVRTFGHCDAEDLARVTASIVSGNQRYVVATDGCFPTFGRVPPLRRYAEIVAQHDAWLIVDESHSFGSVGKTGRGACEHEGILGLKNIVAGGSASKGLGAFGGLAIGSSNAIARLWQAPAARGAALGISAGAAMLSASLKYLREHPERFEWLRDNADRMRDGLKSLGISCYATPAPIFAFTCGSAAQMQSIQAGLYDEGIFIIYSNYVGAGPEGALRIAVYADHKPDHITRLIAALRGHLKAIKSDNHKELLVQ